MSQELAVPKLRLCRGGASECLAALCNWLLQVQYFGCFEEAQWKREQRQVKQ